MVRVVAVGAGVAIYRRKIELNSLIRYTIYLSGMTDLRRDGVGKVRGWYNPGVPGPVKQTGEIWDKEIKFIFIIYVKGKRRHEETGCKVNLFHWNCYHKGGLVIPCKGTITTPCPVHPPPPGSESKVPIPQFRRLH